MHSINKTYRIISLTLALLIFISSVGFSIDMHYCQGQLKSISFVGKAKSCHEMDAPSAMQNCPHHKKMLADKTDKKGCCDDRTVLVQSDIDKNLQNAEIHTSPQLEQCIIAYVSVFLLGNQLAHSTPNYTHYKPPILIRDIPVLIQSFLI